MKKTIEQLLELKKNPYYTFSPEEKAELDAFLYSQSEQQSQAQSSGKVSEKSTPATVINKNKFKKETGKIEVINDSVPEYNEE